MQASCTSILHQQPFVPVFPKESLPSSPANNRGVTYLKAVLEVLGKPVELPDNAPRLCIKEKDTYRLRPIRNIADAFWGFDVVFADTGKSDKVYTFNMHGKEVSMLTEFILGMYNPDLQRIEYEYLKIINASFIMEHGDLNEKDFEKIFNAQKLMATLRLGANAHRVMFPGDTLQGAYYNGKHPFTNGVILSKPTWATEEDRRIHFCAEPYIPYITESGKLDTSGGPFFSIEQEHFSFIGEEERLFWCFGHDGACGNGGIHFPCRSNRWALDDKPGI